MKRLQIFVLLMMTFFASMVVSGSELEDHYWIRLKFTDKISFQDALKDVQTARLDITGVSLQEYHLDLVVSEKTFELLASTYDLEILREPGKALLVDPEYLDPDEMIDILVSYAGIYPDLTKLISIGDTEEDRTVYAMKITENADEEEDKLSILFNAQHHAREVMTGEILVDMIDYLLTNYGTDPQVTHWVDTYNIWIVPHVNPDGINYVFSSYDMWRKDRHPPPPGYTDYGIDPNRNYPSFWGSCGGSSGSPSSEIYRGQFPAESYCVDNMITFASSVKPVFSISYHSYSELVIYPYGCNGSYTPDQEAIAAIGQGLASVIERDNGTLGYTPGTCWEILYATDGGDIDWYYTDLGTFPFVLEVNASSFQPSYSQWRDVTVERQRAGWQYLLNRLEGPMITGYVIDACTGEPLQGAEFSLQEIPLTSDELPRVTNSYGRFWYPVIPGDYHMVASADGYGTTVMPVSVGNSRAERTVVLVPDGSYGVFPTDTMIYDFYGEPKDVIGIGEIVNLELSAMSIGSTTNVTAALTTTDPNIVVLNGFAELGDIPDGETGTTLEPHFEIQSSPAAPEGHIAECTITFSADQQLCSPQSTIFLEISNFVYQCPVYQENLDADPGYTIDNSGSNGWAFGEPTTGVSGPYSGSYCFGTNLSGNYSNNSDYRLTSTPFDCTDLVDTELHFYRFLQNELNYDTAYVKVSNDNINWTVVWSGYAQDTDWTEQVINISEIADGQPAVYVRWRLRSDYYVTDLGFYIDDISICGRTTPEIPPTPVPTWTPNECINNGDVNQDSVVTAGDAQLAFQIALGVYSPTYQEECAADCNGNGIVTAGDAQEIFLTALGSASCVDPI
jgi:carboxypeptidase T